MKKLLISLCLLPVLCFAAPKKALPKIEVPAVQVEPEITQEDLFKTVQHIQELSREQQKELDAAKAENEKIKNELGLVSIAHSQAQKEADQLQLKVNKVTDDRNKEAALKDAALDKLDVYKLKIDKLTKEVRKLKFIISSEAAGLCMLLLLYLGVFKVSFPYGILGSIAASGAIFWLTWAIL